MSYSSFIFRQANIPLDQIPYVIVGQGAVNVLATIVAVRIITLNILHVNLHRILDYTLNTLEAACSKLVTSGD